MHVYHTVQPGLRTAVDLRTAAGCGHVDVLVQVGICLNFILQDLGMNNCLGWFPVFEGLCRRDYDLGTALLGAKSLGECAGFRLDELFSESAKNVLSAKLKYLKFFVIKFDHLFLFNLNYSFQLVFSGKSMMELACTVNFGNGNRR